jgi:hypothetical protein
MFLGASELTVVTSTSAKDTAQREGNGQTSNAKRVNDFHD